MAMDRSSFLPTIKCSSCGVGIEISHLADHVCATTAPTIEEPISPKLDRAATFGGASFNNRFDGPPKSGRMPPPRRIDPYAANKPFRIADASPMSNYSDPQSRSPLSPVNGRTPFQMNRSATSPMPRSLAPPSPDLASNADSPFPFFPSKRSQTPTSGRSKPQERLGNPYELRYAQPSPMYAPLSPRTNGGESVMKRMDTIAPGPFDGRRPSTSSGPRTPGEGMQQAGHKRTNTQGSVRSNGVAANSRTSMASTASQVSTFSNGSVGLLARPKPGMGGNAAMPAPPPPPPPPPNNDRTEGIDDFLARLQKETMQPSKIGQDGRSKTFPMLQESRDATQQSKPEPAGLTRRPTDIESSGFVPRSNNMFPSRSSSRAGSKQSVRKDDLPPLPPLPPVPSYPADPVHTPSDSGLSEDSYASSGFRSAASSRSSPPTSEAGHSRQASRIARSDYGDEQIQRTTSPESFAEPRASPLVSEDRRPNGGYNRGRAPEPLLQPPMPSSFDAPESPLDPAIQRGLSPRRPAETKPLRDPALSFGMSPPRIPESEPRQQMTRRPTQGNRGKCRGCSDPIMGKSVKDSSGRLTGRYHKSCFVCRTCGDGFPTAEFYVFNNSPYCEQHYHELNGSLCRSCNRGIEGQYLETDRLLKFHPRCFTCSTCRIVLRDDYYEVGGRNYCERHAQATIKQQNNSLAPGGMRGRNLQKRRTRMMMMS